MIVLEGARVYTPRGEFVPCTLVIDDGRIEGRQAPSTPVPDGATRFNLHGLTLVPGFVDAHVHGGHGLQLDTDDAGSMLAYARWVVSTGVTAFLPTTLGLQIERLDSLAAALRQAMIAQKDGTAAGAHILGVHCEGPFVNPLRPGALSPAWLHEPSPALLDRIMERFGSALRRMTLAPELPGALDLARRLLAAGVDVSAGHSNATYEEAIAAFECGIGSVTHLFNAMSPLHHRAPGLVGAALLPGVACELIADGIHVHPGAMQVLRTVKSTAEILAVTDAMEGAGMPDGDYSLGTLPVHVRDGAARLSDGTLAGSTLTADRALRLLVHTLGLSLGDAITMLSTTPARVCDAGPSKGQLLSGYDADIVALDDALQVVWTMCRGNVVFDRRQVDARNA